jgi:C4-dicarboxylate transporter, DctM subunit
MSHAELIGVIGFLVMLTFVLTGVPIFVSMIAVGFVGMLLLPGGGLTFAITQFTSGPFAFANSYDFAVLPLFLLVGVLAGETDVGRGAYRSVACWTNRLPGGLMIATIGGNAVFGAVSGMSIAGNMVFSRISLPEMYRYGYDRNLSMGCITAGGALNVLIPPSMPIVMFCILATGIPAVGNLSIGKALVCGIGPGITLMVVLSLIVLILARVWPHKIPTSRVHYTWRERFGSLVYLFPILCFFLLVIGGTFMGWFPATVGGAIGCVALVVYGLARRVPAKKLLRASWDACVMNAGIFPIIIGGRLFSRFIVLSGITQSITDWLAHLSIGAYGVFLVVWIFYIFCGCVMDIASIIIITIPIVFPLLAAQGYDPYLTVILLVFVGEMAGLTPPIGMNVFAVANALRVDPGEVFKGIWPFFLGEALVSLLLPLVPIMTLGIPKLFGGGG